MVRYSLLRLLIFFGALSLLWLLGLRDRDERLLLVALSAVLSMAISFVVLRPFREDYARQVSDRLARRMEAKEAARATSDEHAEDGESGGESGPDEPAQYR